MTEKLILEKVESARNKVGLISPYLTTDIKARKEISNAYSYGVVGNNINEFDMFISDSILYEDDYLFKNLDLKESSYLVPRLPKYIGTGFGYNELINSILYLKEYGLDIENCKVILGSNTFEKLKAVALKENCTYINSQLHIYGIPILSDSGRPYGHKRIPEDLLIVTHSKLERRVFTEIKTNGNKINYMRKIKIDFKPHLFFTIRLRGYY